MPTVHLLLKSGTRHAVNVRDHNEADELLSEFDKPQHVITVVIETGIIEIDTSELQSARVAR